MIPEQHTLLRYKAPRRITDNIEDGSAAKTKKRVRSKTVPVIVKSTIPIPRKSRTIEETEDILNSILPPLVYEEGRNMWVKEVASTPATRFDVINLENKMEKILKMRGAKMAGLCSIRREIFSEVMDEIIRQVTINCAEPGLLLVRVRNEVLMSTQAYRTLYESSIAFGIRKLLATESEKQRMEKQITTLNQEIDQLVKEVQKWKRKLESAQDKAEQIRYLVASRFNEDQKFLLRTYDQLKSQLQSVAVKFVPADRD